MEFIEAYLVALFVLKKAEYFLLDMETRAVEAGRTQVMRILTATLRSSDLLREN